MSALIYLLVLGLVARWVLGAWQGAGERAQVAALQAELMRLGDEVDTQSAEIRRLAEENSFMVRLLSEGSRPSRELPKPEHSPDPNPETP